MKNFKLLTLLASLLACALVISINAQAAAYAVATENLKNGFIVATVNGVFQPPVNPFLNFGTPVYSSFSSAKLAGLGTKDSQSSSPPTLPPNALASNGTGSIPARLNEQVFASSGSNTYYTLFGMLPTAYSWGDAIVVTEQTATGSPLEARDAAESNAPKGSAAARVGTADAGNEVRFANLTVSPSCGIVGTVCSIDFSFMADPYLRVALDIAATGTAMASLGFEITLTDNKTGKVIFAWAPDGNSGGISGGLELADSENLNKSLNAFLPGDDFVFSGPYGFDVFSSFRAFTDALAPGTYTLVLSMPEHTDVSSAAVPEPATLALLSLAFGVSGLAGRKKKPYC